MVENIIKDMEGSPVVVRERVGNAPSVVPVQFTSAESANKFLSTHRNKTGFPGFFPWILDKYQSKRD